jgi:alkanesulfonate monooxygenase SsuD/methylene tetrahydromethanopterin reductase-like flavin-dependent oxidoreductase (luciferase family)
VEKDVSIESPFFKFDKVNSLPIPTQQPHPPIWGAAVNSRQSFAWLGEQGYQLLVTPPITKIEDLVDKLNIYRESFVANAVTKKPTIAISLPILIRNNQSEAEAEGDHYLSEYIRVWADATDAWNNCTSTNYLGYTGMSYALRQNTPQKMRDNMQAFIGTPQKVVSLIKDLVRITQVDQILWQVDFGGKPFNSALNTLDLFTSEVLPLLKEEKLYAEAV